jgi:hypothetical protein
MLMSGSTPSVTRAGFRTQTFTRQVPVAMVGAVGAVPHVDPWLVGCAISVSVLSTSETQIWLGEMVEPALKYACWTRVCTESPHAFPVGV